jgi:transcription elongation factor Elf1
MGKRKSSKKPAPKKTRAKLDVAFACPFCNAGGSEDTAWAWFASSPGVLQWVACA